MGTQEERARARVCMRVYTWCRHAGRPGKRWPIHRNRSDRSIDRSIERASDVRGILSRVAVLGVLVLSRMRCITSAIVDKIRKSCASFEDNRR